MIYQYDYSLDNGYTGDTTFIKTNKDNLSREEHDSMIKDFLKRPGLGRSQSNTPQEFIECLKANGYEAEEIEENHPKMPFNKENLPWLCNISGNY